MKFIDLKVGNCISIRKNNPEDHEIYMNITNQDKKRKKLQYIAVINNYFFKVCSFYKETTFIHSSRRITFDFFLKKLQNSYDVINGESYKNHMSYARITTRAS